MPARHKGETAAEHFWSRVERRGPDECWPHKNKPVPGGYVQVRFDGRRVYAHVLAYELTNGPVPDGHDLDHTCHGADRSCNLGDECPHRRCCNPAHGEPVTPAENNRRARYPNSAKYPNRSMLVPMSAVCSYVEPVIVDERTGMLIAGARPQGGPPRARGEGPRFGGSSCCSFLCSSRREYLPIDELRENPANPNVEPCTA